MKRYIAPDTSIVRIHVSDDITGADTKSFAREETPSFDGEGGAKSVDFDEEDEMDSQDTKWE